MRDASTRRATRLARLVVLTVALPSLLLTGLGMIAVSNEEVAAAKRIEELYQPVAVRMARHFNTWMEERLVSDEAWLPELVAWLRNPVPVPVPPSLERRRSCPGPGLNYFVIDDGVALWPERAPELPPAETRALEAAVPMQGVPNCAPLKAMVDEMGCEGHLALALCENTPARYKALEDRCESYWHDSDLSEVRTLVDLSIEPEAVMIHAEDFALRLGGIGNHHPAWWTILVARKLSWSTLSWGEKVRLKARHMFQAIATREELVTSLTARSQIYQPQEPTSGAIPVRKDWRRVIVTHTHAGALVGYELVPDSVSEVFDAVLAEEGLEGRANVELYPLSVPTWWWEGVDKDAYEEHLASWLLLRKTDLAWTLGVRLTPSQLWSLEHSRRGLYLWSLVLLVTVLTGGVGYSVYAIHREGRLSTLKTDFVSSVSHDLRTPLTSIRMFTESLLMGRVRDDGQRREYLEVIAQEAERLSRLTERILDFSRMEAGRRAYAEGEEELEPLVRRALRSCRPFVEESEGRIDVEIPDELPPVRGDRDALIEVIINLVSNAVKYSVEPPRITIRAQSEAEGVRLDVKDRGIGIAPHEQRRIFDKFHRVDCRRTSEVGGCGIGLSLVQHIVEAHGGRVGVKSQVGVGSTFQVWLPVSLFHDPRETV